MPSAAPPPPSADTLVAQIRDARRSTLALVDHLSDEDLLGPQLDIVNPLLWEIGHVGWFQERFVLRQLGGDPPLRADGDALWDSMAIAHDDRWHLRLPSLEETVAYLEAVRDRSIARLERAGDRPLAAAELELATLALAHEDMHTEAFTYTRQTHGWHPPDFDRVLTADPEAPPIAADAGPHAGDVEVPGGTFFLGSPAAYPFTLDNEQWEHPVELAFFRIARAPVTQVELAEFIDDGGYRRDELWSEAGLRWRRDPMGDGATGEAEHPVYWRRGEDGWERRVFDRWVPLEPHRPAIHVSWYEAEAWCRWAGRRLPTEAEWEAAASLDPALDPARGEKRFLPWGLEPAGPARANLDWAAGGTVDVAALPAGDSPLGCRQMIGNVWEWTASDFGPYPGFSPGPYREYSEPWFGDRKVLRGGCWATRGRMLRSTWRNYYTPDRRDVWAGFRTCAGSAA